MHRPILFFWVLFALIGSSAESTTIKGLVQIQQTEQTARPKRYYMGPYRSSRHATMTPQGPQNTVIYLTGEHLKPDTTTPRTVEMIQRDEMFIPYVLPIQVGTSVSFPNEDDFYHNVFSVMSGERFDLGRYAKGETTVQRFEKPGVIVVRCEIHPGMKAYIHILDTPLFTVPSKSGEYTLENVPPGTYQLFAWHPEHGTKSQNIIIPESGTTTINFSF